MRLIVKQTECAGKLFWVVRDTGHSWFYHGPFEDETAAHDFARAKNSAAWKALLGAERTKRKAAALEALTA